MSKRSQPFQGGEERYTGMAGNSNETTDTPKQATAAQMARRKIAQARKPSGSQRSSRAATPTGNVFGQQSTQSMPSFQMPGQSGTGFGGDFNFSANASSNPFTSMNGDSGTPPPTTFQIGGTSQQNGAFGSNGASFGSNPFGTNTTTDMQQNGFKSAGIFGQTQTNAGNTSTSTLFGGFGQNSSNTNDHDGQPNTNGLAPSTASTSSFPSFGKENTGGNPFKTAFGQSQPQTQSTPSSSFSFGQSTQQNGGKPATPSFNFGQTTATPQQNGGLFGSVAATGQTPKSSVGNAFAGFGQQNGNPASTQADQMPKPASSPLFGVQSSSNADVTAKPANSNPFSASTNTGTGLFGSTPPPESGSQATKLGDSVFSTLNKKDGITPNMFTSSRNSTPKPSTGSIFSAPPNAASTSEQTPKPTNIFGASNATQSNGTNASRSGGGSGSVAEQPPKSDANPLSAASAQSPAKPAFTFGQTSQQDSNAPTLEKEAEGKSAQPLLFGPHSTPTQAASMKSSTPANESLFDRITNDPAPPLAPKSAFAPSTSFFNAPKRDNDAEKNTPKSPPKQSIGLFDQMHRGPSPNTASKPSFNASGSIMSGAPSAAPWLSHGPSALTSQVLASQKSDTGAPVSVTSPAKPPSLVQTADAFPEPERGTVKALNEGLRAHLAKQDPTSDWSSIMQYYLAQAAKISRKTGTGFGMPNVSVTGPSTSNTPPKQPSIASSGIISRQQPASPTKAPSGNIFSSASATPISSATSLLKPPSTAPVNRKRAAEDNDLQSSATEKRPRADPPTQYPKLPENASETAKLFQASLDRSLGSTSTFSVFGANAARTEAPAERETAAKSHDLGPGFGGFQPSGAGALPSAGGFTPSAGGFKPSASSATPTFAVASGDSGNFLAAFGRKANEQEEKDRKKRKMEDYDSDEETEEAWAARDKLEQDAKRQKILDAAKSGGGFTPSAGGTPTGGTPAPESEDGVGSEAESDTAASEGKSLFDRISHATATANAGSFTPSTNLFATKTPSGLSAPPMTSDIFAGSSRPRESIEQPDGDKTDAEREQGTGDHTWKPDTPIKFGGGAASAVAESTTPKAPPPAFGNLFGNKVPQDTPSHLSVPKASFGFNFGGQPSSLSGSRATTPGMTTDGEGASTAGEGDDEEGPAPTSEPQVEDQTGLRDSEKENEDLLFSLPIAKAMKWDEKKNDAGEMTPGWVDRGKGPLYILKHKATGKVRVVLKVPPYGVTKMNFSPLKDMTYEVTGSSGRLVQGAFIDHLGAKDGKGKLGKWMIHVGKKEDAEEIAKVLMRERA